MCIRDRDKEEALTIAKRFSSIGYGICATAGTASYLKENGLYVKVVNKISEEGDEMNVLDVIRQGQVNYVVNTCLLYTSCMGSIFAGVCRKFLYLYENQISSL